MISDPKLSRPRPFFRGKATNVEFACESIYEPKVTAVLTSGTRQVGGFSAQRRFSSGGRVPLWTNTAVSIPAMSSSDDAVNITVYASEKGKARSAAFQLPVVDYPSTIEVSGQTELDDAASAITAGSSVRIVVGPGQYTMPTIGVAAGFVRIEGATGYRPVFTDVVTPTATVAFEIANVECRAVTARRAIRASYGFVRIENCWVKTSIDASLDKTGIESSSTARTHVVDTYVDGFSVGIVGARTISGCYVNNCDIGIDDPLSLIEGTVIVAPNLATSTSIKSTRRDFDLLIRDVYADSDVAISGSNIRLGLFSVIALGDVDLGVVTLSAQWVTVDGGFSPSRVIHGSVINNCYFDTVVDSLAAGGYVTARDVGSPEWSSYYHPSSASPLLVGAQAAPRARYAFGSIRQGDHYGALPYMTVPSPMVKVLANPSVSATTGVPTPTPI